MWADTMTDFDQQGIVEMVDVLGLAASTRGAYLPGYNKPKWYREEQRSSSQWLHLSFPWKPTQTVTCT